MKITISGEDFNRIMRVCIPSLDRLDGVRDYLKYIEVRGWDGQATATACNGYHMAQCTFNYQGDTEIRFMLPRYKTVRKDRDMTIVIENGEISIADGEEMTIRKDFPINEKFDMQKVIDMCKAQPNVRVFGVSRKYLRRLLDSFGGDDHLLFEVAKNHEAGIIVRNAHTCGLVMPLRITPDYEEMRLFQQFTDPLGTTKGAAK